MKKIKAPEIKFPTFCVAIASLIGLSTGSHAATTIYADGFNRTGTFNASSPDTTLGSYGGTAGATWTAGGITLSTGTDASVAGTAMGYLPFVPQAGHIYTLTVYADLTGDWSGIGFTTTAAPSLVANLNNVESGAAGAPAWILYQSNVANLRVGGSTVASSTTGGTGYNTVALILDTTGANWKLQGSMNGNTTSVYTFATNPNINTVAISGAYGGGGMTTDSFSLTTNIPEPSAALIGSLGMLALLRRRR